MISMIVALLASLNPETYLENLEKPCANCESSFDPAPRNLKVFMSFSVPLETWQDLSAQLEKTEGVFVLRGFPDGSLEKLGTEITELKLDGVHAPIDIDPEGFITYGIDAVPAFVLEDGKKSDRLVGNLRLDAALREIIDMGETSEKAKEILQRMENR